MLDSILLPEKPDCVDILDSDPSSLLIATYQLNKYGKYTGSFYKITEEHIIKKQIQIGAGIFRFIPFRSLGFMAVLTNGSLGIVSENLDVVQSLSINSQASLLSVSTNGDDGDVLCSDSHGNIHLVNINSSQFYYTYTPL